MRGKPSVSQCDQGHASYCALMSDENNIHLYLQTAYISCNIVYSDSQVAVMLVMVYEHQLASSSMSQCSPAFKRSSSSDFYNVKVGI